MTNNKTIQVIEAVTEAGSEWGISFTCCNPEPEAYFRCNNSEDAFRLKQLIETKLTHHE